MFSSKMNDGRYHCVFTNKEYINRFSLHPSPAIALCQGNDKSCHFPVWGAVTSQYGVVCYFMYNRHPMELWPSDEVVCFPYTFCYND